MFFVTIGIVFICVFLLVWSPAVCEVSEMAPGDPHGHPSSDTEDAKTQMHEGDSETRKVRGANDLPFDLSSYNSLVDWLIQSVPAGRPAELSELLQSVSEEHKLGITLGAEKSAVLSLLSQGYATYASDAQEGKEEDIVVLELSSHIGDATLSLVEPLFNLFDTRVVMIAAENEPSWQLAGTKLLRHALVGRPNIEYHPLSWEEADISSLLAHIKNHLNVSRIDIVVLDHDNHRFADDVRTMIESGLVRDGSILFADNVQTKRKAMTDYIKLITSGSENVIGRFGFHTSIQDVEEPYKDKIAVSVVNEAEENEEL